MLSISLQRQADSLTLIIVFVLTRVIVFIWKLAVDVTVVAAIYLKTMSSYLSNSSHDRE